MRTLLSVFILTQVVFLLGCPEGGADPPVPCDPAVNCVVLDDTGDACCFEGVFPKRKTVARNINPQRAVIAVIIPDKAHFESGRGIDFWTAQSPLLVRIEPNASQQLPDCPWTNLIDSPNICTRFITYSVPKACFTDDSTCKTPTAPANPGLPPFSCEAACKNGDEHCLKIPYTDFNPRQQEAIFDLRFGLQRGLPPYNFQPEVAESVFFASAERCGKRTTQLLAENAKPTFQSRGDTCISNPLLPRRVPLIGTPFFYSSFWVKVPSVIKGELTSRPGGDPGSEVRLFYDQVESPWITAKLDVPTPDNTRQDVLKTLTVTNHGGAPADIVLSGKDFVCVAITDVPPVDHIRGRKKR